MNAALENKLVQDFPEIFRDAITLGGTPQTWGIKCPAAWEPAIRAVCQEITAQVRRVCEQHPTLGFRVVADQIQDKFGRLHFYWHSECSLWIEAGLGSGFTDEQYDAEIAAILPEHQAAVDRAHHCIDGAVAVAERIARLVFAPGGTLNSQPGSEP